jgi:hypothetical protein
MPITPGFTRYDHPGSPVAQGASLGAGSQWIEGVSWGGGGGIYFWDSFHPCARAVVIRGQTTLDNHPPSCMAPAPCPATGDDDAGRPTNARPQGEIPLFSCFLIHWGVSSGHAAQRASNSQEPGKNRSPGSCQRLRVGSFPLLCASRSHYLATPRERPPALPRMAMGAC